MFVSWERKICLFLGNKSVGHQKDKKLKKFKNLKKSSRGFKKPIKIC